MIKKRKSVLFRIAVFVSVVYLGFVLISQQVQINSQKAKLVSLNDQYKAQIEQNGKTQRELTDNVKHRQGQAGLCKTWRTNFYKCIRKLKLFAYKEENEFLCSLR